MDFYRPLPIVVLLALQCTPASAQDSTVGSASRSDSIEILHTRIELDLTQTSSGIIRGDAVITFTPRVPGITTLPLDLLLQVDSVMMNGTPLTFTHPGEVLLVDLQNPHGPEDTLTLTVSYQGNPVTDASGFGGFYTLSNYQYDLGVAFDAVPHSYGRAWFPCFDNFVERCSFDFVVHTNENRSVFANGALVEMTDLGGGERISHWRIEEPIPSYLASVAAGNYTALLDTFPSVSGADIPVVLAALPGDTAQVRGSFAHLKNAFDTYERWFGPYRWNRVGYVLTSAGAMEHATNICYPDFAADGTLGNEDLIAHELSHHWFGDLITCARPQEMYMNEGFADFCAKLFIEDLYGEEAYKSLVRSNHYTVVATTHLRDGGWYALADVPQNVTYGETSYKKGSDIARTLRATLGDSLFSAGMKQVFSRNAYTSMSSAALRDSLAAATGTDLTDFFNAWIFQPGGAAFMVDSFSVVQNGGLFDTQVHIRQKTRGGANFFHHVPVTLTCIGAAGETHQELVDLDGEYSTVTVPCPFPPVAVRLNDDERLALSTTVDTATISTSGQRNLPKADVRVIIPDTPPITRIRVEEFWVPADEDLTGNGAFFVSPDRWWRVETDIQPGTAMSLRFTVDGRPGFPTAYDPGLVSLAGGLPFNEDSLVILYRPNAGTSWTARPTTITHIGSTTDSNARLEISGLAAGDYTFGWRSLPTSVPSVADPAKDWRYFPDPATDQVTVTAPPNTSLDGAVLLIHDLNGRIIASHPLRSQSTRVDVSKLVPQTVLLSVRSGKGASVNLGPLHITH
ncbi:MAG: M1 family metallopeptidase [Flavobacteriales bacterium]|nr:M1 family metallopeptidase [Flavobacteriales bacterium]